MAKYFQSIQSLRGLAAGLVVVHHLTRSEFQLGAAGVDLFFVISGFIMGTVAVNETTGAFVSRRVARIAPLYWAFTLFVCLLSIFGVFRNFTFDLDSLVKSLLFIPYYNLNENGHIWPLIVPGWTLNLEMLFYFIFSVGIALGRPVGFSILAIFALVVGGAVWNPSPAPLVLWTSPLMLEFVAGLVLAVYAPRIRERDATVMHGFAFIVASGVLLLAFHFTGILHEGMRVLVFGLPAALIVTALVMIERGGKWPSVLAPAERLGDASYSLYITHVVVVAFFQRFFGTDNTLVNVGIFLACIAVSFVVYNYFERPTTKAILSFLKRRGSTPKLASSES